MAADSLSLSWPGPAPGCVDQYQSVGRCCSIVKMGARTHLHWDEQDGGIVTNSGAASLNSPSVWHTQHLPGLSSKLNILNILISQSSSSQEGAPTSRLNDILPETWLQFMISAEDHRKP